ncbi:MAG: TonB-dependent receptor [Pseudomonadota bacterium]
MKAERSAIASALVAMGMSGGAGTLAVVASSAQAAESARVVEEVVVQARRQDETLQDVPVTITSVGGQQLDNFQLDQAQEIAERIPNFNIQTGGSGSGGTLNLRGVGSSAISAAFDSAVALDIDGVQIARMRMVQSAFMDLQQVDVLKGPQSLYFGKSASAGVVAFRSADPTDEFEAKIGAGIDFEQDGNYVDGFISGPLTETIGARFAFRYSETDEFWENTSPAATDSDLGERDLNGRLTLTWNPSDNFSANFKTTWTDHVADNAIGAYDMLCIVPGDPQETSFGGALLPSGYDCDSDDGRAQLGDTGPVHGAQFGGINNITPFEELQTNLTRLQLDWDINENLTLTSLTSYFELEEEGSDAYGYDINGFGSNITVNTTEAVAQEFRLAGSVGNNVSFLLGAFYQDRELVFDTYQHAFGAAQFSALFGLPSNGDQNPPVNSPPGTPPTENTSDWRKVHTTDSETLSFFGSVTVQATEKLEITAGVRYAEEERSQVIEVPELHSTLTTPGLPFAPLFTGIGVGFNSGDIEFDDDQWAPEVSALYALTDEINLFAAYKVGYKAGGVDNSALPSASLAGAVATGDFSSLIYDTEVGEGFEVGMKGRFLEGALRLDVTAFRYVYEDLQVQTFNAQAVQFATTNAGELVSQGLEADFTWLPNIDGLSVYGAVSFLDAAFSDSFAPEIPPEINSTAFPDPAELARVRAGYDLDGRSTSGAADFGFNAGFDYSRPIGAGNLEVGFGFNTSFSDEYETQNEDPVGFVQDSFWLFNARAFIGSTDGTWNVSLMGRNLADELYVVTSGGRPFSDTSNNSLLPGGLGLSDTVLNYARGRQLFLQFEYRL